MGIGLVIAVLGIGSTLASTISINGGQNVEFGQGVQRTVYCGGNKTITLIPISGFMNNAENTSSSSETEGSSTETRTSTEAPSPGTFYLSGIRVEGIPTECSGKDFVFSAYDNSGSNEPVTIISDVDPLASSCSDDSSSETRTTNLCIKTPTVWWINGAENGGIISCDRNRLLSCYGYATLEALTETSFIVHFDSNSTKYHADVNLISRIVIETQDDTFGSDAHTNSSVPIPLVKVKI